MENVQNTNQTELYQAFIKSRKTFRRAFILSCILYMILFAVFLGVTFLLYGNLGFFITRFMKEYLGLGQEAWAYFLAGPCIVLAPILIRTYSDARNEYKRLLLYPALETVFGSGLQVLPNGRMERDKLQAAHILRVGEQYKANDLLVGTYHGHTFQICDFCKPHFKGQIFALECNGVFPQRLCIAQKGFRGATLPQNGTKCVKTGDEVFDKIFSCYVIQSKYKQVLLSGKMKHALQVLAEITDEKCMITVSGDMLYLVLKEQRDSFEPPLFRPFDLEKETTRIRTQLQNSVVLLDCLTADTFQTV